VPTDPDAGDLAAVRPDPALVTLRVRGLENSVLFSLALAQD
jgi:hypothetical protein